MKIGHRIFDFENEVYIMGILNVTPDSFSDGGRHSSVSNALFHCERMLKEGADIIDVGGESTRPSYTPVEASEEIERILPVIEALKKNFDCILSVDTFKAETWKAASEAGVHIINDIWGFKQDPEMAAITARHEKACVLMHNRKNPTYENFMTDLLEDLRLSVHIALKGGVPKDKIILDPGIGFAKTPEENLIAINRLEELHALGLPLLLGTSRKGFIGRALGNLPSDQRVEGTCATTVTGVLKGVSLFRVHDVKENRRAADMALAIRREKFHG